MFSQILLGVLGVTAIWLSQQPGLGLRKYACIFGLLAQPFWFYTMYQSEQWGVFVLCFFYAYSWGVGFYNNWIKTNSVWSDDGVYMGEKK